MFHTDDEFLREIERQPAERTLRLVYADWLDEHDDPRGELIRVEEEMREVPVYADRFWELKPRRNELRLRAGDVWCGRMRYGTECEPVFRHGIPDGWRERWRLIREFTERWDGVPMPDVGGRQGEIAEAESRLGRTLPPSVREWIAFAHDCSGVLSPYYQMIELPGHHAISLQVTGGYMRLPLLHWAVRHDDLSLADPPIQLYRRDDQNQDENAFIPDTEPPS